MVVRYVIGFFIALLLSIMSYVIATTGTLDTVMTMGIILTLAVVQLIAQLIFFLHLDIKGRSVSRTATFAFTIAMMLVIVIGSLWIMRNLDYRMGMSGDSMNEYMKAQNKKGF
jgi:cytochrome o ubiquinol oxidase operon protein cyoD